MIEAQGVLGDLNNNIRKKAIEKSLQIDQCAAATLECPMIRVSETTDKRKRNY